MKTNKAKYIAFGAILGIALTALWACPTPDSDTEYVGYGTGPEFARRTDWANIQNAVDPALDYQTATSWDFAGTPSFTGSAQGGYADRIEGFTEPDWAFKYRQRYGGWEYTESAAGAEVFFIPAKRGADGKIKVAPEDLEKVYAALGLGTKIPSGAQVAVKLNMGEKGMVFDPGTMSMSEAPHPNILKPTVLKPFFDLLDGDGRTARLVDSTTFYDYQMWKGPLGDFASGAASRASATLYRQAAVYNGFKENDSDTTGTGAFAATFGPIDILNGEVAFAADNSFTGGVADWEVPIPNGKHLQNAKFGGNIRNYDWIVSVAHFKGHNNAGVGGTFKNLAIGIGSYYGKQDIHQNRPGTDYFFTSYFEPFMEKIVEYNLALTQSAEFKDKIVYINVLNDLALGCDCVPSFMAPVEMEDIGIIAGFDPVAVEKASIDKVYQAPDGAHLVQRMEAARGLHQIRHAARVGLGNPFYKLTVVE